MSKDREICDAPLLTGKNFGLSRDGCHVYAGEIVVASVHGGNRPLAAYIAHFDPAYQAKILDVVDAARASLKNAAVVCDEDVALAAALTALDGHGGDS
jgi:hypothetical protein